MPKVGDRVEVKAKVGARTGKVTAVSGQLLRVLWDTGEETSILPAAGVLSVLPAARSRRRAASPTPSRPTAKRSAAKKTGTSPSKASDAKAPAKSGTPAAKKGGPDNTGQRPVADPAREKGKAKAKGKKKAKKEKKGGKAKGGRKKP